MLNNCVEQIYPQGQPEKAVSFKEDIVADGYHHAIFNKVTGTIGKRVGDNRFLELPIKLPEVLFKGPIKDDNILNKINKKNFDDLSNVVVLSETISTRLMGKLRDV